VWKDEYAVHKERAQMEVDLRALEGGHVHGYGGGRTYWDAYYSDPSSFTDAYTREWYCSADTLRPHIKSAAPGLAVELGCGTSMMSAVLEDMGYSVVSCDFSLAALNDSSEDPVADQRLLADICRLPVRSGSLDLVVDKATIDTLLCAPAGRDGMVAAYQEAARVLRPGGKLLTVSHSSRQVVIESLGLPFRVREERTMAQTRM
jgi:SAM-dependent methyltransferase